MTLVEPFLYCLASRQKDLRLLPISLSLRHPPFSDLTVASKDLTLASMYRCVKPDPAVELCSNQVDIEIEVYLPSIRVLEHHDWLTTLSRIYGDLGIYIQTSKDSKRRLLDHSRAQSSWHSILATKKSMFGD